MTVAQTDNIIYYTRNMNTRGRTNYRADIRILSCRRVGVETNINANTIDSR